MAALEAPGLHVSGLSLPGTPGIIVGHNDRIAWGVTNLHFNVQDLYREKIDDRTGQYVFQGHLEQARMETEIIPVKGQKPVELRQWVTRHGPVSVSYTHLNIRRWRYLTDMPANIRGRRQRVEIRDQLVHAGAPGRIECRLSVGLPVAIGIHLVGHAEIVVIDIGNSRVEVIPEHTVESQIRP